MEPTEVESQKTFWKSIEPTGTQLKLHYRHCDSRKTTIKQNKIKAIEEDDDEEHCEEQDGETDEDEDAGKNYYQHIYYVRWSNSCGGKIIINIEFY